MKTVNIAEIDCDVGTSTCERFDVNGFPTIKFISKGMVYEYNGPRDVESFKDFMNGGYKGAAEQSEVPKELSTFDFCMKVLKKVVAEVIFTFDSVFGQFGMKDLSSGIKIAISIFCLLLPAMCIVGCIYICEFRQSKKYEKGAEYITKEEEEALKKSNNIKEKTTSPKKKKKLD